MNNNIRLPGQSDEEPIQFNSEAAAIPGIPRKSNIGNPPPRNDTQQPRNQDVTPTYKPAPRREAPPMPLGWVFKQPARTSKLPPADAAIFLVTSVICSATSGYLTYFVMNVITPRMGKTKAGAVDVSIGAVVLSVMAFALFFAVEKAIYKGPHSPAKWALLLTILALDIVINIAGAVIVLGATSWSPLNFEQGGTFAFVLGVAAAIMPEFLWSLGWREK